MNVIPVKAGRLWLVLLIVLVALAACQGNAPRTLEQVPRMGPSVLYERLSEGDDVLVVDTRPQAEYEQQHIAGAISVPYNEIASRLDGLPRDRDLVLYCT